MKKLIFSLFALLMICSFALVTASSAEALQRVRGYTTKRGTYVVPHYRTTPNRTRLDNYSTKGNINPFTGKKGTVNIFR